MHYKLKLLNAVQKNTALFFLIMNLKYISKRGSVNDLTPSELEELELAIKKVFDRENLYDETEYDYWDFIILSSTFDINIWPDSEEGITNHYCTLYLLRHSTVYYNISLSFLIELNQED